MKKLIFLLILAWAGTAMGANCGGETECACGDTVTSDYTLTGDLECTNAGNALTIGAHNVDIDGGGYTISGDRANVTNGINSTSYNNVSIKNITIQDTLYNGIIVTGSTTPLVEDCTVTNCGTDGQNYDGIFMGNGVTGGIIRGCLVSLQQGTGSGIDASGSTNDNDVLIENNKAWDCDENGFSCSGDAGQTNTFTIQNNVTWNVAKGFYVYETADVYFYHNTCGEITNTDSGHGAFYFQGAAGTKTITMRNNAVKCLSCNQAIRYQTADTTLDSDYNAFLRLAVGNAQWGNIDGATKTFAQWKTATSGDANSQDADPDFTDAASGDYSLKSTSPCIDAGVYVNVDTDYTGCFRPQGDEVDIGAFEYRSGVTDINGIRYWNIRNPGAGARVDNRKAVGLID